MQFQAGDSLEIAVEGKDQTVFAQGEGSQQTIPDVEFVTARGSGCGKFAGAQPRIPICFEVDEGLHGVEDGCNLSFRSAALAQLAQNQARSRRFARPQQLIHLSLDQGIDPIEILDPNGGINEDHGSFSSGVFPKSSTPPRTFCSNLSAGSSNRRRT